LLAVLAVPACAGGLCRHAASGVLAPLYGGGYAPLDCAATRRAGATAGDHAGRCWPCDAPAPTVPGSQLVPRPQNARDDV